MAVSKGGAIARQQEIEGEGSERCKIIESHDGPEKERNKNKHDGNNDEKKVSFHFSDSKEASHFKCALISGFDRKSRLTIKSAEVFDLDKIEAGFGDALQ